MNKENQNDYLVQQKCLYSAILKKNMNINIFLPPKYNDLSNLPVLFFLHGRDGSQNIVYEINMHKAAAGMIEEGVIKPLIIVFPQMDNSSGLNSSPEYREVQDPVTTERTLNLGRYQDYFLEEAIPFVQKTLKIDCPYNSTYIGGVSGGGYAALHIALNHLKLFSRVGGHMPAIELTIEEEDEPYYYSQQFWIEHDPVSIAEKLNYNPIDVYLDCGDEDEGRFYIGCEKLHNILSNKGIKSQNHLFKGKHDLEYISSNVEKYLLFYGK